MRIAILSDIHSNLQALEAVLAAIGSVDAIWQLGDVVGYGPDPDAVVARLSEAGAVGVRGNHDAAVVGDISPADFLDFQRAKDGYGDVAAYAVATASQRSPSAVSTITQCPSEEFQPRSELWN